MQDVDRFSGRRAGKGVLPMRRGILLLALLLALSAVGCGDGEGEATGPDETIVPETGIDQGSGSQNFSVGLNAPDGGAIGSANVTAEGGNQLRITIQLEGGDHETLATEIREGTCATLGADPVHELTEVEGGTSETLLDASMDELRETPHALVLGVGASGRDEYVACGDLVGEESA
jgi:hypothetical protein